VGWLLRHDRAAATVVLALAVLVYLAPLVAGRQMGHGYLLYDDVPWRALRPPGLTVGNYSPNLDLAVQNWPLTELARHQVDNGALPLWNPSSYAGTPLLADLQSALLYPLTWLGLLMPFGVALGWICALKLLTAAVGTYMAGRALRLGPGPAFVAALVYAFSAPVVSWLETPLGTVVTLLPWLFLATERLRRAPSAGGVAAVAAVVALSAFAGHPETAALSSASVAVYLGGALAAERALGRLAAEGRRRPLRAVGGWLGGHALGLAAAAVVIVPFLAALSGSVTSEVHGAHSSLHLPTSSGLVMFLPNVFGEGLDYRGPLAFYISTTGYFGVAALLLAGAGAWRWRREPVAWGLLATAIVALMVIFDVPPVSWLVPHLPPFSGTLNVRVFYVVALAGALLAGAGLEALVRRPLPLRHVAFGAVALGALVAAWFGVQELRGALPSSAATKAHALGKFALFLALGALVLVLAGRVRARAALVLAAAVVVLDLGYMHDFNPLLPAAEAYPPKPPAVSFLQSRPGPFRVSPIKGSVAAPTVLPPNTPALYGLEAPQGYDYPQSARWSRFATQVLGEHGLPTAEFPALVYARPRGPSRTGLRLVNVRYYVAPPRAPAPGPGLVRVYAGRDAAIYEDRGTLPRAYLVPRTIRLPGAAALRLLARGGIDPRRVATVPRDAPPDAGAGAGARRFRPLVARRLDPAHWRIDVPPGASGWLVLANAFRPDWRAKIDGRHVRMYPTNYATMGLPLAPGARTVDVELDRRELHTGAAVSLLAALAIAVLTLWPRLRRFVQTRNSELPTDVGRFDHVCQ
jgi:hypothetical protein